MSEQTPVDPPSSEQRETYASSFRRIYIADPSPDCPDELRYEAKQASLFVDALQEIKRFAYTKSLDPLMLDSFQRPPVDPDNPDKPNKSGAEKFLDQTNMAIDLLVKMTPVARGVNPSGVQVLALQDALAKFTDEVDWQTREDMPQPIVAINYTDSADIRVISKPFRFVVHEVRNTLTSVKGFTQLIIRNPSKDNAQDTLDALNRSTKKLHENITGLEPLFFDHYPKELLSARFTANRATQEIKIGLREGEAENILLVIEPIPPALENLALVAERERLGELFKNLGKNTARAHRARAQMASFEDRPKLEHTPSTMHVRFVVTDEQTKNKYNLDKSQEYTTIIIEDTEGGFKRSTDGWFIPEDGYETDRSYYGPKELTTIQGEGTAMAHITEVLKDKYGILVIPDNVTVSPNDPEKDAIGARHRVIVPTKQSTPDKMDLDLVDSLPHN